MDKKYIIETKNLTKQYGSQKSVADLNIHVQRGRIYGLLVVFFSKTYVFSILLCVFYSVLNMSATALFDALPKTILWFLPTPLTTFWSAGDMAAHGIKMDLEQMTGLIPSTFQVVMILGIMAIISFWLIDRLYKQRGE